jgi:hypothetical protein
MKKHIIAYLTKKYDRAIKDIVRMEARLRSRNQKSAGLAFRLLARRFSEDIFEFLIVLFSDPSESFIILKKRDEMTVCDVSYVEYRLYSKKIKLLSLGGASSVFFATLTISFIVNFVMPNLNVFAATFNWNQTNWNGGTDGGTYPNNTNNRDNWTKYSSATITIDPTGTPGKLTVTGSALVAGQSDQGGFASGTTGVFTEVTGTQSVRLKIVQ